MYKGTHIEGLKELKKEFEKLSFQKQKRTVDSAIKKAMKPMQKDMKSRAPSDTKTLRKSIGFFKPKRRSSRYNGNRGFFLGPRTTGANGKGFHAHLVEYGTSARRPKRGRFLVFPGENGELIFTKEVKGQSAQPFIMPAYQANKAGAIESIGSEIKKILKKNTKLKTR